MKRYNHSGLTSCEGPPAMHKTGVYENKENDVWFKGKYRVTHLSDVLLISLQTSASFS